MENSPVPMENEDALVLSFSAVAAVDAVVWTVVPLAGEHMEAFCDTQSNVSTAEPDEGCAAHNENIWIYKHIYLGCGEIWC